jgi:hypothetical protein
LAGDVTLVLTGAGEACRAAGVALFPGASSESLAREEFRPPAPFSGRLFGLFKELPRGALAALVVPVHVVGGAFVTGDLVPIADHVGLEAHGPLAGRWPAAVPREFPSMTAIYQPDDVRSRNGARVYSSGVVAAGVADARRLTPFEAWAVREGGWPIVSDSLVTVAVVAAYYGVRLAACGLVWAPRPDRE